jgi:hypothetical protein
MGPEGAMKYGTTQTRLDQTCTKSYPIETEQAKNGDEQTHIQDQSGQNCINRDGTWKGETFLLAELPDGGESNRSIQMNV